jgi:hypothetical protein
VTRISARWLAAAVLFAWTLLPAIACAADLRQMTEPEMACCKKMVGKCDMGAGQYSCCDQTVHSQDATRATLTQVIRFDNTLQSSDLVAIFTAPVMRAHLAFVVANDGSPPESPPGRTILRI